MSAAFLDARKLAGGEKGGRKRLMGIVDFEAVKAVVDATHRYKEIFYTE